MNKNQKMVLKYYKNKSKFQDGKPITCLGVDNYLDMSDEQFDIYGDLTYKEEFEIILEYAKWGLKKYGVDKYI